MLKISTGEETRTQKPCGVPPCGMRNSLHPSLVKLVLERRLELLSLTAHAPKACAYTNSATPAFIEKNLSNLNK